MLGGISNIGKLPELKKRILFVLFMLFIYRLGVHIPTPGVDAEVLSEFFSQREGSLLGLFDMFSGGALSQFSIFSLGIMPYISASIIMELLTVVVPHLEALKKEGQEGRRKITQYSRYGTVALSIMQGFMISVGLEKMNQPDFWVVIEPGWGFRMMSVITLTAGTAFIMWLGEQITEKGIGNGISLIIFSGIVVGTPKAIAGLFTLVSSGSLLPISALILVLFMVMVLAFTVFCERGQRRIPVQYAQRMVGRKMMGAKNTHLPLKINPAGVIPPIFASSLIMFPATILDFVNVASLEPLKALLAHDGLLHNVLYVGLIIFFCYFYTGVTFNPTDVAENMKKNGGFIPGIRPGVKTAEYIDRVLTRITLGGALYISMVCLIPNLLYILINVPFYFGGTALLIVVGVSLDFVGQVHSHLLTRHYEGFLKKGMAGRNR